MRTFCTAGAFAQQVAGLTGLAGQVQRALARSLCLAAVGLAKPAQIEGYIHHLLGTLAGQAVVSKVASSCAILCECNLCKIATL